MILIKHCLICHKKLSINDKLISILISKGVSTDICIICLWFPYNLKKLIGISVGYWLFLSILLSAFISFSKF